MLTLNDYLICLLGWIVFSLFNLTKAKNKFDNINAPFDLKHYMGQTWDDWIFTLGASIGLLIVSPNIFLVASNNFSWMEGIFWSNKIPLFIGAFGGPIFQGLYNVVKKKIAKIEKDD